MSSAFKSAGIALGSNVGDRLRFLQFARDRILSFPSRESPFQQSSIYETSPVGCEDGAANFYNAVIELAIKGSAHELMQFLQAIERELGRPEKHPRNVSRTIDLDLLYYGDERIDRLGLRLPHPRLTEREFVLRPLAEIAPQWRLPEQKASVAELLVALPKSSDVRKVHEAW